MIVIARSVVMFANDGGRDRRETVIFVGRRMAAHATHGEENVIIDGCVLE
jgi:hypothetical protein